MYDSYGKLDNITVSSADPPREKFTGKEFDEDGADDENITGGMRLFYFGARYYDAEVGLWTSTDPKEQFWGHYIYTGNGYNPIVSVDPDGNEVEFYYLAVGFDQNGKKIKAQEPVPITNTDISPLFRDKEFNKMYDALHQSDEVYRVLIYVQFETVYNPVDKKEDLGFMIYNFSKVLENNKGIKKTTYTANVAGSEKRGNGPIGATIFHELYHFYSYHFIDPKAVTSDIRESDHDYFDKNDVMGRIEDLYRPSGNVGTK